MAEDTNFSGVIQLEILSDDQNPATPATLDTVAEEVRKALRKDGYIAEPAYTGTKGGELFQLILEDTALVVGIVGGILSAIKTLQDIFSHKGQEPPVFKLEMTLNGIPLIDAEKQDAQQLNRKQIEERIQKKLPAARGSSASMKGKVTLRVQQPSRKHRK